MLVQVPGQPAGGGVPGQAQAANVQCPSPLAHACRNNNEAFCTAVFDLLDLQANANPMTTYKVKESCQNANLKQEAIRTCPRSCAFCCLTPQYNCTNATTRRSPIPICSDDRANCAQVQQYCTVELFAGALREQFRRTDHIYT
ncbi:unnamed protein product [Dracunculus medinensis]|uniref:ShKT domain-containing protein n=1 Tax=Dracunculus medinensis TaxID=318479 RepID=A0A0N4URG0_DRAME|nr:unnamed protein product [Dracunculus medinensis]